MNWNQHRPILHLPCPQGSPCSNLTWLLNFAPSTTLLSTFLTLVPKLWEGYVPGESLGPKFGTGHLWFGIHQHWRSQDNSFSQICRCEVKSMSRALEPLEAYFILPWGTLYLNHPCFKHLGWTSYFMHWVSSSIFVNCHTLLYLTNVELKIWPCGEVKLSKSSVDHRLREGCLCQNGQNVRKVFKSPLTLWCADSIRF